MEKWICVRDGEDVCMWFAAKWIFAGTMWRSILANRSDQYKRSTTLSLHQSQHVRNFQVATAGNHALSVTLRPTYSVFKSLMHIEKWLGQMFSSDNDLCKVVPRPGFKAWEISAGRARETAGAKNWSQQIGGCCILS
jgi:hypothetical protein